MSEPAHANMSPKLSPSPEGAGGAVQPQATGWWTLLQSALLRLVTVGGILVIAKLAVAAKEIVVADRLGSSDSFEAFIGGTLVPLFFVNTVAFVLGIAFLPAYVHARENEGRNAAQRLLSGTLAGSTLAALIAALALLPFARPVTALVARSFTDGKLDLATTIFRLLLPLLLLGTWSSVLGGALLAEGRARAVAGTQLLTPLVTLALLAGFHERTIGVLVTGLILGGVLEVVALGWLVARQGIHLRPSWEGVTPQIRELLRQFWPLLAAQLFSVGCVLVDQAMSAGLASGAVAALNYGTRIVIAGVSLASVALNMLVFPRFALQAARRQWRELRRDYLLVSVLLFVGSTAATLVLMYFSREFIHAVFERGSFTPADTLRAARVQLFFAPQIPFQIVGIVGVKVLTAVSRNRFITITAAVNLIVNFVGNVVLSRYLGVDGIALSTTVVMFVSCAMVVGFVVFTLRQMKPGEAH